jgi:hypothetical protein
VQDRWLRPLANHWVRWAARRFLTVAYVRADARGAADPRSLENAADGDSVHLSYASQSLAGSIDGSSSDGSLDDDSSEQETGSEPVSDSSDAD